MTKCRKLFTGNELIEYAKELGVSFQELNDSMGVMSEPELQRRVQEAERSLRENKLWWFAVISAVASVVSALTALAAVLK